MCKCIKLPQLKNCCCYIPLRYGLLIWGYIKLVVSLILYSDFGVYVVSKLRDPRISFPDASSSGPKLLLAMTYEPAESFEGLFGELLGLLILFTLCIIDICFTILFLVGLHRKTAKLIFVYYIYSIVLLCFSILVFGWVTGWDMYYMGKMIVNREFPVNLVYALLILLKLVFGVCVLVFQIYIILVTKSEIRKLNDSYRSNSEGSTENTTDELEMVKLMKLNN